MKSADEVAEQIEAAVVERGARAAIVDYVQLLDAPGNTKRDKVEYTTGVLKALRQKHNIPIVLLCQMNREIEKRKKFIPVMSDLEHAGRLEQDADVILFCVWPHKIVKEIPDDIYQVWVAKNRNRPIKESMVELRMFASRQMVASRYDSSAVASNSEFAGDFDEWNQRKDIA
jgi:replicative DNA helicase